MQIERITEGAAKNAFFHKIADIPGGVTVKTSGLTATELPEGTPIAKGANGLYLPIATGKVVEAAGAAAVTYAVAKGNVFIVGDKIAKSTSVNVNITAIDRTDANKDVITVDATLGAKAVDSTVTAGGVGAAVAVTGSTEKIRKNNDLYVSAWVIAVLNSKIVGEPDSKPAGVLYL